VTGANAGTPSVTVVGSANADLILPVTSLPLPGETVLAGSRRLSPGGKGLNQAVAAARAGVRTRFVAAVGSDDEGAMLRAVLETEGIEATVRATDAPTGLAVVMVDDAGENSIVVAPGANAELCDLTAEELAAVTDATVLLVELEIPLPTVVTGARAASEAGVLVVLNAAPAAALGDLLGWVDVLVVNEGEARALVSSDAETAEGNGDLTVDDVLDALLAKVPNVIVTLGGDGAVQRGRDGSGHAEAGRPVTVVDTTGAGDTFAGYLAAALAEGSALPAAMRRACAAAALCVQRPGAVPAVPERVEVDTLFLDPLVARAIDEPTAVPLGGSDSDSSDLAALDYAKILAAPVDPAERPAWRATLHRWRTDARQRLAYTGTVYDDPDQQWAAHAPVVALVWMWDELLYDHDAGTFDVERFLGAHEGFGGLDAVILWHAYPVIGLDPRNQFDWYRDIPELRVLVSAFQDRGVRVFFDYNPWDVGTRRPTRPDADELVALVAETGAAGLFLDTLKQGDAKLVSQLQTLSPAPALEGESSLPLARIEDHALSWAQWFADSEPPGVLRARWFEQRHTMHQTRRWNRDHSSELQSAWVNGAGMLVWECVFGVWVGWNDRDRAALRVLRRVHRGLGEHFTIGDWTPLVDLAPQAERSAIFGSLFERPDSRLWAVVNRREQPYSGVVIDMPATHLSHEMGVRWFDVARGHELSPVTRDGRVGVQLDIPARGLGGLLQLTGTAVPAGLAGLLESAAADRGATDTTFPSRPAVRVQAPHAPGGAPANAVGVAAGPCDLPLVYRRRETGIYDEAPYVEEWKPLPPRLHNRIQDVRSVHLSAVAVDRFEVTNEEYKQFLDATGYRPTMANRFLAHWRAGRPVPGTEQQPVTYVDLRDARAFARWRGARLPTEHEWQVAATAGDPLERREPLVWNWTESEHSDGRTRFAIIKGGSRYQAEGSDWYLDGGVQAPEVSVKLLLPGAGLARSECVGFRCAVDVLGQVT